MTKRVIVSGPREARREKMRATIDNMEEVDRQRGTRPDDQTILLDLRTSIEALAPVAHHSARATFYQQIESLDCRAIVQVYNIISGGLQTRRFKNHSDTRSQPSRGSDPQLTDAPIGEIWRIVRHKKKGGAKKGRAKLDRWGRPYLYREGDSRPRDLWRDHLISHLYARLKAVYRTDGKTYQAMVEVLRIFFGQNFGSDKNPAQEHLKRLVREVRQS
jgi:hypothetical protein